MTLREVRQVNNKPVSSRQPFRARTARLQTSKLALRSFPARTAASAEQYLFLIAYNFIV